VPIVSRTCASAALPPAAHQQRTAGRGAAPLTCPTLLPRHPYAPYLLLGTYLAIKFVLLASPYQVFSHVIMSHSAQVPHASHAPQPMAPRFIRAQPFYLFGAQVILIASWKHTNQLDYPPIELHCAQVMGAKHKIRQIIRVGYAFFLTSP
jgi:hypothetical protein